MVGHQMFFIPWDREKKYQDNIEICLLLIQHDRTYLMKKNKHGQTVLDIIAIDRKLDNDKYYCNEKQMKWGKRTLIHAIRNKLTKKQWREHTRKLTKKK